MISLLAESYLHRLDPFAIRFHVSWLPEGIRWYGLSYVVGFIIGWMMIAWMARTGRTLLPRENGSTGRAVSDLMTYIILGVIIGGRLGFVLFYDLLRELKAGHTPLLWEFTSSFPFWGVLQINKGGMASHGGMIGVIVACWLYARSRRVDPWSIFDLAAFGCPPGFLLGRVANFVNAELWGKALPRQESPPWWSVKYPEQLLHSSYDIGALATERLELVRVLALPENVESPVLLRATEQALLAGNREVIELVQPALTAYYPSQLIQALAEGLVLWLVLAFIWRRRRKPGVIAGWFLVVYGLLRIATEMFRQPDEGVPPLFGVISRGQQLSILMIAAGAVMLWWCLRRPAGLVGGLGRTTPGVPGPQGDDFSARSQSAGR